MFPGAGRASRRGDPPPGCCGASGWGHQTCGAGKVTLRGSPPQPKWRRRSAGPWVSLATSHPPLARLEQGGWAGSLAGDTSAGPGTSLAWLEQLSRQRPQLRCTCSTRKSRFIQPSDDTIPGVSQGSCLSEDARWLGGDIPPQRAGTGRR